MGLFSLFSRKSKASTGSPPTSAVERWKDDVYALFASAYGLEKEDVEEFVDEAVQQGQTKRKHRIETANARFLRGIGFRDVGGRNQTWLDEDGRELVLHDVRLDELTFRIKNQRGGRSRIKLDPVGQMVEYLPG
ncbi:DUF4373 domain-containing protein [Aureimonas leprariae]|uniref:Uncharacterized protein n=1 Tax=Plantimonas leprariae TaxID=2615207 RepID=A0A7V7PRI5_9HYPH|nr:DUF4373 domain-containing protein [Aureimonas leprariae]KAB0681327.1 hypothetical protein F6X38_05420 [Aureimonas leprariae]